MIRLGLGDEWRGVPFTELVLLRRVRRQFCQCPRCRGRFDHVSSIFAATMYRSPFFYTLRQEANDNVRA